MPTLRKDGRLQTSVTVVNPFTGEKEKKFAYGYTEEELFADKARKQSEYSKSFLHDTDFKSWCDEWLVMKRENEEIDETTEESYYGNIQKHILPYMPLNIKLSEVLVYHVKLILRNIKNSRTKQYTYTILNNIFSDAKYEQKITTNPCDFIKKPKHTPVAAEVISPEDYLKLMNEIKGTQMYYLFNFALDTGARRGEIAGAKWSSLRRSEVEVLQAIKKTKKKGEYLGSTKSDYSVRVLPLTPDAMNNLLEWKKMLHKMLFEAGLPWDNDGYIFRSERDLTQHIPLSTITHAFMKLKKQLGFSQATRFHSLRHTQGTLLAEADLSPKKIQARLGHASAAFTMDTYVHKSTAMQDGVVEALEQKEKAYRKIQ